MAKKVEACLVCGADIVYFDAAREMKCVFCGETFLSNASCDRGHYVCDACHGRKAIENGLAFCRSCGEKDPVSIIRQMMGDPYVYMHGPEHHVLVAAALLTAYRNCGGQVDYEAALSRIVEQGSRVPGGVCGFWGSCGAAVSTGIFVGAVTSSTPLTEDSWGLANRMTAASLQAVGEIGGPRCCKRNSYTAIGQAVAFCRAHFGVELEYHVPVCSFFGENAQCIGKRCPYHPVNHRTR